MAKRQTPFELQLILNQWIIALLGYNVLEHRLGNSKAGLFRPFANLASSKTGIDEEGLHFFYRHLSAILPKGAEISASDLMRYELNIVQHTTAINEKRRVQIEWKYYQWLSLLFTEIYLDRYFTDVRKLKDDLNVYLNIQERFLETKNYVLGLEPFTFENLNKVCYQNATGSGKTLLMHVNLRQFWQYAREIHRDSDFLGQIILITPNVELSKQHEREFRRSGIPAQRLPDRDGVLSDISNNRLQVLFTEVTKLGQESMPLRTLGDQNLIVVDEGHRGLGGAKDKVGGWFLNRSKLAARGFVFEYSATFKEAISASGNQEIKEAYAKSVIFDYSYGSFHYDGYGKDYRILNLPKTSEQLQFNYLSACLLTFYQQLRLYIDKVEDYSKYNLEKPLWVFVGSTVSRGSNKDEAATVSDVGKIIAFLAKFLGDTNQAQKVIKLLLEGEGEQLGLIDVNDNDIFSQGFSYLRKLVQDGTTHLDLINDIRSQLFQATSGTRLCLEQIKGDENEILLRVEGAPKSFGLINIGDTSSLISHLNKSEICNLRLRKSDFSERIFDDINSSSSPANILIGSKRFIEGWDCWRVSTLGLMHVGKAEGAQIIQLFGRGVRLKGYGWSLQRSEFATPNNQPDYIQHLETLNVFGVEATFMEKFRAFLDSEGLSSNYKETYKIPLNVTYDVGHRLMVLRPRVKADCGREYDFALDGASPLFGEMLKRKKILVDWYPKIDIEGSIDYRARKGNKNKGELSEMHTTFLDEADLFFQLERHKQTRGWETLNIPKSSIIEILREPGWYELMIPKQILSDVSASNISSWQKIAAELLYKYAGALYKYKKQEFLKTRLELRPLTRTDANIPIGNFYEITVDASAEALIEDIKRLRNELPRKKDKVLEHGGLKGCRLANHLYEPLLHYGEDSDLSIKPVSLVESEMAFIGHLANFLQDEPKIIEGREINSFLLRNEGRGKGMGFFEAGNFYPDFLLWLVSENRQGLVFIDPHGLVNEKPDSEKVKFHKTIKGIEERLDIPGVSLHSFIITPTSVGGVMQKGAARDENQSLGRKTIKQWNESNVYFMEEQKEEYLEKIYTKIVKDMFRK